LLTAKRVYMKNIASPGFYADLANIRESSMTGGRMQASIFFKTTAGILESQVIQAQGEREALFRLIKNTIELLQGYELSAEDKNPSCRACGAPLARRARSCEYCGSAL